MNNNKKVLGIICRRIDEKLHYLALRNNSANPSHGGDFWYVVTGGVEENESIEDALKRELFEETGIDSTVKLLNLNTLYTFTDKHGIEWEEFLELIAWEGDDLNRFVELAEKTFK